MRAFDPKQTPGGSAILNEMGGEYLAAGNSRPTRLKVKRRSEFQWRFPEIDYSPGRRGERGTMKMVAEYLQKAQEFERFAASETNATRKAEFLSQADAYRKLAVKRAKDQGLSLPPGLKS